MAHRGAPAVEAENTLPAFEAAVRAGADAVELDVRLSADGVVVVMHDPLVDRTTDGSGLVRDLTLAQLGALRIITTDGSATKVPTLEETLRALSGRVAVDLELKQLPGEPDFEPDGEPLVDATLAVLAEVGFEGAVLLSSFDPVAIASVRSLAPQLPTGLLVAPQIDVRVATTFARGQGHPWVLPSVAAVEAAGAGYVEEAHAGGMRVGTWIVDEPARALALLRAGVDAVATNDPAALVIARREAGER